jgi:8-oxo-dGTP pyrophosphatase MutT (NUDIX family)
MDKDLPSVLQKRLSSRRRVVDQGPARRQAAVLAPLFYHKEEYHLLFTRRTERLATHSGEVAFPGGLRDAGDESLLRTALREAEEEIGLRQGDVQVLGPLDDLRTRSTNYIVTPFVGLVSHPYPYRPDPTEVAEIFSVPLSFLQDRQNLNHELWIHNGEEIPVVTYRYQGYRIWGATQRITENLLEIWDSE